MNCKPIDLAYIVASDFPQNVGRVVQVTEEGWQSDGGWAWIAVGREPLVGYVGGTLMVDEGMRIGILDMDLRPISGVPVHDEVLDEVTA